MTERRIGAFIGEKADVYLHDRKNGKVFRLPKNEIDDILEDIKNLR